jgi:hypothetical protein
VTATIRNPTSDPAFRNWMVRRMTYHLRKEIYAAAWKTPPTSFWKTWRIRWKSGEGLLVSSAHPAALILDQGVARHPMTYLQRRPNGTVASRVIKGMLRTQKVPLRRPSAAGGGTSFRSPPLQGAQPWTHPGLAPKRYLSKARLAFEAELRPAVAAHIRDQMTRALASRRAKGPGITRQRR